MLASVNRITTYILTGMCIAFVIAAVLFSDFPWWLGLLVSIVVALIALANTYHEDLRD